MASPCIEDIIKAAEGKISAKDAGRILRDVSNRAKALAKKEGIPIEDAANRVAEQIAIQEELKVYVHKRAKLFSLRAYNRILTAARSGRGKNLADSLIEYMNEVANAGNAKTNKYLARFAAVLEDARVIKEFKNGGPKFSKDVTIERWQLTSGEPFATNNKAAQIVAKAIRDRQAETQLLAIQAGLQDRIFQAEQQKDALTSARLKGELDILNIQFQYAQDLANEKNVRVQEAIVAKGLQEVENARLKNAQTLQEIETNRTEKYNEILADLEYEKQLQDATTEQAKERLRIEYEMRKLQKEGIYSPDQLSAIKTKKEALVQSPAQKRMKELETSLASLTNIENVGVMAADNIGAAFGQAFQDIANGSATAQEALAGMMKSIGENFVNMAAQIIAQQMTMIILGSILKALGISTGGGGGGGFPSADVSLAKYAPLTPFADGGFVTSPTQAIVGEGGQPEYIIPASKMQAAMARYSAGARGDAVIPSDGGTGAAGGTATMAAPTGTIDIRYTVERINTVDYVTADQFQRGMAQAAQQGAAQGEQRTLRRLQQSRTTRSRLGMA